jgi:3-hydroxyisobutyrate dehydrogenase
MRTGVLGTGSMGAAIARRLRECDCPVMVWNRMSKRSDALVAIGCDRAETVHELLGTCEIVIVCLSDAAACESVFMDVVNPTGNRSPIIVNTATIGAQSSLRLQAMIESKGLRYREMPVSGGPEGALAGNLTIYVGEALEASPLMSMLAGHLAGNVVSCRSNAAAQQMKVLNNLCEAVNLWGAAEAYALGLTLGISAEELQHGLPGGRGDSRYLRVLMEHRAHRLGQVDVSLEIRCKDLTLATDLQAMDAEAYPLTAHVRRLFEQAAVELGRDQDQCRCLDYVLRRTAFAQEAFSRDST